MSEKKENYKDSVTNKVPGSKFGNFVGNMDFSSLSGAAGSIQSGDYGQALASIGGSMPGMIGAAFKAFGAADSLLAPLVKLKSMDDKGELSNSSAFSASLNTVNKAESDLKATEKKGLIGRLFSKKKTNRSTEKANTLIEKTNDILTTGTADLKRANEMESTLVDQQQNILSGSPKPNFLFKEGGTLGESSGCSIIPEGKLHAHKHRLKDSCEFLKEIPMSDKGIPVLEVAEDGTFRQHAEIERGELILSPEVAAELMRLCHEDSKASRIEAGKILTKELIHNTEDHTEELL